jgi:hypothetical protein
MQVIIYKWIWYKHAEYYLSSPSVDENLKLPPQWSNFISQGAVKA